MMLKVIEEEGPENHRIRTRDYGVFAMHWSRWTGEDYTKSLMVAERVGRGDEVTWADDETGQRVIGIPA